MAYAGLFHEGGTMGCIKELREAVAEGDDLWACLCMTEALVRHMPSIKAEFKSQQGYDVSGYSDHNPTIVWAVAFPVEHEEPQKPAKMKEVFFQ